MIIDSKIETKEERFKRIANARTNKIIEMINLVGNLSNKSAYSYTDEQVNAIFTAIRAELDSAEARFTKKEKNQKFTL